MENFRVKIAGSEEIVPVVHRALGSFRTSISEIFRADLKLRWRNDSANRGASSSP